MTLPQISVSERLAAAFSGAPSTLPVAVAGMCDAVLMDVAGLCVAARNSDYLRAALRATAEPGACTLIGHAGSFNVATAALCNGTAAHGEDYDDTFEGGPVHAGAVIIPAVLATARTTQSRGQRRRSRRRGGLRSHVPPVPGGPQARAQGRVSSHRGVRRVGRGGRRGHGAAARCRAMVQCSGYRRQHGIGHHRISRRRRVDQTHASGLGGAGGLSRRAHGAGGLHRSAHAVRRRARLLPRLRQQRRLRFHRHARRRGKAVALAPTSRSRPTPVARWRILTSTARASSLRKA